MPYHRLPGASTSPPPFRKHAVPGSEPSETEQRIGELVAGLVDDGATLQMGIGVIPDAVLSRLGNKLDLISNRRQFGRPTRHRGLGGTASDS